MNRRFQLDLACDWWVSISARDATLAATRAKWSPQELEHAADAENHPQRIDLPGGPKYGKRPLSAAGATGASPAVQRVTEEFVGPLLTRNAKGERLPHPWLSYAKRVAIPRAWAGHTVFLHLDNVRYHVTVSVNGRSVARYVGGLEPHRLDLTKHVTPGRPALLLITVGDSSVSGHKPFDAYHLTGNRLPTCKEIENNLVHPVNYGGADRAVGKVSLEAVPPVRVEYVFADPKVSRGLLRYTVALANDTPRSVRVRVRSEALRGKQLVQETLSLPARSVRKFTREIPWPDAILWDTDHPHLYDLRTTLSTLGPRPSTLDTHRDCFGFREFTINGHSFFLNGKKIHLHGQAGHTSPDRDMRLPLRDKITILRAWKERGNVNHIRLHAKPQDKGWVEAADRVGMLLTTETALWTTGFHSFDWAGSERACYENVRRHFLEALVRRDRNNPSVVIWSLSNEMSPITPFDLEHPKMAAMTRAFEKIIAEAEAEDPSRVIQMSSAMDFLGRLRMYNLHYPKSWQAFPDYPHTAYWLDSAFLFPWYGPRRKEFPPWSWRKDKPLYIGEFTCVFGATPDSQASIVGDAAFEREDFGTALANEKLWPMEIHAYRRRDVSGFCAWSCITYESVSRVRAAFRQPHVRAHTRVLRPLAVLDHSHRTRYFTGDEVAVELSVHNDTRHAVRLALTIEVRDGRKLLWTETWPASEYGPAENKAFPSRFRAPAQPATLTYRATLRANGKLADRWEKRFVVSQRTTAPALPADFTLFNGTNNLTNLDGLRSVWITPALRPAEWEAARPALAAFVQRGGCVILDRPAPFVRDGLPVPLRNGKGYTDDERLEITYAFRVAPHHPLLRGLSDAEFALWGADYYVARRCFETPQAGNAVPLLVAGADRRGLTCTPLLELHQGAGSWLVSTLELLPKLTEEPLAADLLARFAGYRPQHLSVTVSVSVTGETLRVLREVGFDGANGPLPDFDEPLVILDGACLDDVSVLAAPLHRGATVYLHDLGVEKTHAALAALRLPGEVLPGKAGAREFDTVRHAHALADGLTNNYLYWIVDKAKLPPWALARLHPEPASALIRGGGVALTRRGAVTAFEVGPGRLVIDNLRWQLPDFDEPERPRRFVMTLLTNLGVPLAAGAAKRAGREFETQAERRERGHF